MSNAERYQLVNTVLFLLRAPTDQTTEVYTLFCNSVLLDDSYEKAISRYAWTGTANNFGPLITTDSQVDHIFVSPAFKGIKYGILTVFTGK